jgi:hypothetical protein
MKTYEKLARFIELNDDGPQSCLKKPRLHKITKGKCPAGALTWI